MAKVTINVLGKKVKEYETEKPVTLESVLSSVSNFKKEMDRLGVTCKVSTNTETGK